MTAEQLSEKIHNLIEKYMDFHDVPEAKRQHIRMNFIYTLNFMGFILGDK